MSIDKKPTIEQLKNVGGRPTEYDPDTFPLYAEHYKRKGLSNEQIAENLGISISSFYEYQAQYLEFSDAIKRGKQPLVIQLENALMKRAFGYDVTERTTEMKIDSEGNPQPAVVKNVIKHFAPDVGAIAFALKNKDPENWKDKHEFSGEIKSNTFLEIINRSATVPNIEDETDEDDLENNQNDQKQSE